MKKETQKKHIISVLVENRSGILSKVAGLFSIRGYNIESFSVGTTDDPSLSKMNIAVYGDSRTIEQITKQLHKLIDVVKVHDLTEQKHIAKELCLVRVYAPKKERTDIIKLAEHAGVRIVDIQVNSLLLEVVDTENKVNQFLDLVKPFGIQDVVRSGVVAIAA